MIKHIIFLLAVSLFWVGLVLSLMSLIAYKEPQAGLILKHGIVFLIVAAGLALLSNKKR